jgi:hypothetical protein
MVGEVISLGALGSGVPVMLAGAVGLLVARWGRGGQEVQTQAPARPRMGLVTAEALADLPLGAPGRAGYGTATHLLIEAARGRRAETGNRPTTVPARGTRAA